MLESCRAQPDLFPTNTHSPVGAVKCGALCVMHLLSQACLVSSWTVILASILVLLLPTLHIARVLLLKSKLGDFPSSPVVKTPSFHCKRISGRETIHKIPHASQLALAVKNPPPNAGDIGDVGSVPGLGRSPGGGNSNPLQYSCLENPMDRGAWWATVKGHKESVMTEVI